MSHTYHGLLVILVESPWDRVFSAILASKLLSINVDLCPQPLKVVFVNDKVFENDIWDTLSKEPVAEVTL